MAFTVHPVSSEWSVKKDKDKTEGRTVYRIVSDSPTNPLAAAGATGLPAIGDAYPGSSSLKCVEVSCDPEGQARLSFRYEASYDDSLNLEANPLFDPVKVSYGYETGEESYYKDVENKAATTTAGEPFSELPSRQTAVLTLDIEKNVVSSTTFLAYDGLKQTVNGSAVGIDGVSFAAGTLFVAGISLSDVQQRNGVQYRTLKATLKAKKNGWNQKYESRGLYELSGGSLKRIADGDGAPVESPYPLTSSGTKAASASTAGAEIVLKPYEAGDVGSLV